MAQPADDAECSVFMLRMAQSLFISHKAQEMKEDISKIAAKFKFDELTAKERGKWCELARRKRFEFEISSPPDDAGWGPTKPLSAARLFGYSEIQVLSIENPNPISSKAETAAATWMDLSGNVKQLYEDAAKRLKEQYLQQCGAFDEGRYEALPIMWDVGVDDKPKRYRSPFQLFVSDELKDSGRFPDRAHLPSVYDFDAYTQALRPLDSKTAWAELNAGIAAKWRSLPAEKLQHYLSLFMEEVAHYNAEKQAAAEALLKHTQSSEGETIMV
eukprot:CAMPEP_0177642220 /NCGR_PEP_ID=MMETSP0447-20121125/7470_1 /TAXON_ID=0 /ORGANISM="Stygamoeba regulata, Strain BSH-02190019" /LENGTH=271 /DNA_ID=CAMNT_0019144363 /DNA_START=67 /DNA_END=882 /DNA_ORIENTATION=+